MVFIAFIVINLVSAVLLRVKSRHKTNFYFSGYLSAMSLGLLAFTLDPTPIGHAVQEIIPNQLAARFLSAISYRFSPFFLLMAGLSLSGVIPGHRRKKGLFILATPMILEYIYGIVFPKESFLYVYPDYSATFLFLASWGSLYVLAANIFVIASVFLETDYRVRWQKVLIAFVTLPTMLVTYQAYIMPVIGSHNFTNFTAVLGIFTFVGVVFFAARYGFMGIRLVIGKDFLDSSIKSVTLGTAMLNHAIKNEIQIINACVQNAEYMDLPLDARRHLSTVSLSTQRLMEIVSRIQELTQENPPNKYICDMTSIIHHVLDTQSSAIQRKNIGILFQPIKSAMVLGDPVHFREVIQNIVTNAIEAMSTGGSLTIEMSRVRRTLRLKIIDTGAGISREHLPHVIEPFFTTKRFGINYGLGLSYCYKVMQQHRGSLDIHSEVGMGTTVVLNFPCKGMAIPGPSSPNTLGTPSLAPQGARDDQDSGFGVQ